MARKEELVALFARNRGRYLSGADIAAQLGVTRAAVWKAVKGLQESGYHIEAVPNRGYCLLPDTDVLSAAGIRRYLRRELPIEVLGSVSSTLTALRERAEAGAPDRSVLVAATQAAGRGRMGRSFFSPVNSGVYVSLLLRTRLEAGRATFITPTAALAVCEAIERIAPEIHPEIKWVNDVFVRGKKVCGILTEAVFGMEDGRLDYAVVGVGINAYEPEGGFPPELREIVGSVFSERQDDVRNRLTAAFLDAFFDRFEAEGGADFAEAYRRRCFVIGRDVTLIRGPKETAAHVLDVDDSCALLVRYPDGRTERVASGEISLRI